MLQITNKTDKADFHPGTNSFFVCFFHGQAIGNLHVSFVLEFAGCLTLLPCRSSGLIQSKLQRLICSGSSVRKKIGPPCKFRRGSLHNASGRRLIGAGLAPSLINALLLQPVG